MRKNRRKYFWLFFDGKDNIIQIEADKVTRPKSVGNFPKFFIGIIEKYGAKAVNMKTKDN